LYTLEQANKALSELHSRHVRGAKVLAIGEELTALHGAGD